MSWNLEGSYFETCEVEGVDVSGLTVAAVADTPKVMRDGNWRLGVFIDTAASDEQAEKLGAVFSGAIGGIQCEGNSAFSTSGFSWAA